MCIISQIVSQTVRFHNQLTPKIIETFIISYMHVLYCGKEDIIYLYSHS